MPLCGHRAVLTCQKTARRHFTAPLFLLCHDTCLNGKESRPHLASGRMLANSFWVEEPCTGASAPPTWVRKQNTKRASPWLPQPACNTKSAQNERNSLTLCVCVSVFVAISAQAREPTRLRGLPSASHVRTMWVQPTVGGGDVQDANRDDDANAYADWA